MMMRIFVSQRLLMRLEIRRQMRAVVRALDARTRADKQPLAIVAAQLHALAQSTRRVATRVALAFVHQPRHHRPVARAARRRHQFRAQTCGCGDSLRFFYKQTNNQTNVNKRRCLRWRARLKASVGVTRLIRLHHGVTPHSEKNQCHNQSHCPAAHSSASTGNSPNSDCCSSNPPYSNVFDGRSGSTSKRPNSTYGY